jgi:excisionase family DNA binding protein
MADWKDIDEAAAVLKVNPRNLKAAVKAGRIPALKIGRKTIRIDLDAVRATTDHQPSQAEVGPVIRRRRNDLPPVPDELGDIE